MTVHLLNAAVMPISGVYSIEQITRDAFATEVRKSYENNTLKHYIGYQNTLVMLEKLCDIELGQTNMDQTHLEDGDMFYVARLRRHVSPEMKRSHSRADATPLDIADFDFFRGRYLS